MKNAFFPKTLLCALSAACVTAVPTTLLAEAEDRTVIVRERHTASFSGGDVSFKLLKIKGYSVEIGIAGEKRVLKVGQAIDPDNVDCTVIFEEIATETRVARFRTNCS